MGLRVRSLAGLRGVLTLPALPALPGLSTLALAGAASALCLSLSAGVSVGGTTAAFNAQTTNSAGAVASLRSRGERVVFLTNNSARTPMNRTSADSPR